MRSILIGPTGPTGSVHSTDSIGPIGPIGPVDSPASSRFRLAADALAFGYALPPPGAPGTFTRWRCAHARHTENQ